LLFETLRLSDPSARSLEHRFSEFLHISCRFEAGHTALSHSLRHLPGRTADIPCCIQARDVGFLFFVCCDVPQGIRIQGNAQSPRERRHPFGTPLNEDAFDWEFGLVAEQEPADGAISEDGLNLLFLYQPNGTFAQSLIQIIRHINSATYPIDVPGIKKKVSKHH